MAIKTKDYKPHDNDVIMIDTNLLVDYFFPHLFDNNNYTDLIDRILEQIPKTNILITSVQISELINLCIRKQFKLHKKSNTQIKEFKRDYRSTECYLTEVNQIIAIVRNDILEAFDTTNDNFKDIDQDKLFDIGTHYDFNDSFMVQVSNVKCTHFITNDKDFLTYPMKCKLVTDTSLIRI